MHYFRKPFGKSLYKPLKTFYKIVSENKKETSNNNQIYSLFWNIFLLNVDI